jgi:hypothetical protein
MSVRRRSETSKKETVYLAVTLQLPLAILGFLYSFHNYMTRSMGTPNSLEVHHSELSMALRHVIRKFYTVYCYLYVNG